MTAIQDGLSGLLLFPKAALRTHQDCVRSDRPLGNAIEMSAAKDQGMAPKRDWAGKIAVVSGGSSGIGEATVAEFISRGAKVVILDRRAPTNPKAIFIHCDVSSAREV